MTLQCWSQVCADLLVTNQILISNRTLLGKISVAKSYPYRFQIKKGSIDGAAPVLKYYMQSSQVIWSRSYSLSVVSEPRIRSKFVTY